MALRLPLLFLMTTYILRSDCGLVSMRCFFNSSTCLSFCWYILVIHCSSAYPTKWINVSKDKIHSTLKIKEKATQEIKTIFSSEFKNKQKSTIIIIEIKKKGKYWEVNVSVNVEQYQKINLKETKNNEVSTCHSL